jgi:hypothetical protein
MKALKFIIKWALILMLCSVVANTIAYGIAVS